MNSCLLYVVYYRGVICDYFVHALSTGIMTRDQFVAIVPPLFSNYEHYDILYPITILLCHKNLIYPEDLDKIADKLGGWRRSILVDCRDYLFSQSITPEDLVTRITRLLKFPLLISIYIRCCATVSKLKTEDLVGEFLEKVPVEYLFMLVYVWENYILGWMLLAEDVVIRMGKRLSEYDTGILSENALDRRDYLMRMMNAEV